MSRAVIEGNPIHLERLSSVTVFTDVVVRDVAQAYALRVALAADVEMNRVVFERNAKGAIALDPGSDASIVNGVVRESGEPGLGALLILEEASLTGTRMRFEENVGAAIRITGAPSTEVGARGGSARLSDVEVLASRATAGGERVGSGVHLDGGKLDLRLFRIADHDGAGIIVEPMAELQMREGEIAGNPIGVHLRDPRTAGLEDLTRVLFDRVVYEANGVNVRFPDD